ncbi:MAG: hypothetical protein KAJ39_00505 [Gammaproteobacteria bacterium]|nr:hypothetical protein [Gammaproteobacteria bacterium]
MATECLNKSPMIAVGETFVTKFGDIRLISLYDNNSGMIGIKPNGWTEVFVTTVDNRLETVGDMQVTTNFYTLAGGGAHFWVCGITPDQPMKCNQVFKMQDQNGNPLNGNIKIGTTNLTVIGTGTISLEADVLTNVYATCQDKFTEERAIVPCVKVEVFEFHIEEDKPDIPIPPIPPMPDEPDPDEPVPDEPVPDEPVPDDEKISICEAFRMLFPSLPEIPPNPLCNIMVPRPATESKLQTRYERKY